MSGVRRGIVGRGVVGVLLMSVAACAPVARPGTAVQPRATILSDAAFSSGLAALDSARRSYGADTPATRRAAALVALARDAYERNDEGDLVSQLLAQAAKASHGAPVVPATAPTARRADLWALLDSATAAPNSAERVADIVALQEQLVRAQYTVLGAPACEVWEARAVETAARLRIAPPLPPVVIAPVPPPAPQPTPVPDVPKVLSGVPAGVHFALNKWDLSPSSQRVLDALVQVMRENPGVRVTLEGNTDIRGSRAYNEALSRRRADSVKGFLLSHGVGAERIDVRALGFTRLQVAGTGVIDHARNRRVSLRYYGADGVEIATRDQLDDLQVERPKKK